VLHELQPRLCFERLLRPGVVSEGSACGLVPAGLALSHTVAAGHLGREIPPDSNVEVLSGRHRGEALCN
jgi:hypothetical protein